MKTYEKMNPGENLSWCRPYALGSDFFVVEESCIVSAVIGGKIIADADTDTITAALGFDGLDDLTAAAREVGCAACPFRDACDAMDD